MNENEMKIGPMRRTKSIGVLKSLCPPWGTNNARVTHEADVDSKEMPTTDPSGKILRSAGADAASASDIIVADDDNRTVNGFDHYIRRASEKTLEGSVQSQMY